MQGVEGATDSHEGPAPSQGLMGDGCGFFLLVFFVLFFFSSRRVPVTHLLQNVNPGHNKWNICKAAGVISANCILISAIMGRRSVPSRRKMETSGHVDGSGWIEMSHDQLCPNKPDLAGRTDEVNISEMIESSDSPVLPLLLLSVF